MENLHGNVHVFVLSCLELHENIKHAPFIYVLHLVPTFTPHCIIMVKDIFSKSFDMTSFASSSTPEMVITVRLTCHLFSCKVNNASLESVTCEDAIQVLQHPAPFVHLTILRDPAQRPNFTLTEGMGSVVIFSLCVCVCVCVCGVCMCVAVSKLPYKLINI